MKYYLFGYNSTLSDGVSSSQSSSLIHSDSGVSISGDQTKASKSSLLSTDSGIASDTSLNQQHTSNSTQQLVDISGMVLYHRFILWYTRYWASCVFFDHMVKILTLTCIKWLIYILYVVHSLEDCIEKVKWGLLESLKINLIFFFKI